MIPQLTPMFNLHSCGSSSPSWGTEAATLDRIYVAHASSNSEEQEQQTTRASTLYLLFAEDTPKHFIRTRLARLCGFAFGSVIAKAAQAVMVCGHSDVLTPVVQCQNQIAVKCGLITKYPHTCTAASCQGAGY